jgi:hypothetical protein
MSFETWVDSQITRAQARGDFDNLAGAGQPLPNRTSDESTYEWVIAKARRENIDVLGMLPSALALRKEREDLPRRAAELPTEAAVRALAVDFNDRVEQFWRRPQDGPAVPVGQVDVEALVATWTAERPPLVPLLAAPPPPVRRRRPFRFFRRAQPPGRTSPHS